MRIRRGPLTHIVIHCADTPPDFDCGVEEIRSWHMDPKKPGGPWSDIGYHYVIRRNGDTEVGRDFKFEGAHVRGWNHCSVGICLAGGYHGNVDFTRHQWDALKSLVYRLKKTDPEATVLGHCDFDPGKTCPNFSVADWWLELDWRDAENWTPDGAPPPVPGAA